MVHHKDDFHAKHVRALRTFLDKWKHGRARLWEFHASHCSLTIRVEKHPSSGNLHIVCLGPEYIHGPVAWANCDFTVIEHVKVGCEEGGYVLRDELSGFEVHTEEIEMA